jgi:hypothetical protein
VITVTRRLMSEDEVLERLHALANRYHMANSCFDEAAADHMSDFDALKWLSLCDQLKKATRGRSAFFVDCSVPAALRSIYGMETSFRLEESEDSSSTLIQLAA